MLISIRGRKLKKRLNSEKALVAAYGKENAGAIKRSLHFLRAAPTLAYVPHAPPTRRHELTGQKKGQFSVDLKHPLRLIFVPDHDPVPLKEDGGIDLARVTEIEIIGVEDTH